MAEIAEKLKGLRVVAVEVVVRMVTKSLTNSIVETSVPMTVERFQVAVAEVKQTQPDSSLLTMFRAPEMKCVSWFIQGVVQLIFPIRIRCYRVLL